jgi:hypothetical protein
MFSRGSEWKGIMNISLDRISFDDLQNTGCDHTLEFYDQHDRVLDGIRQMVRIFFAGLKTKKNR